MVLPFLDFTVGHTRISRDRYPQGEDGEDEALWRAGLVRFLDDEVVDAIMDPRYKDVRRAGSNQTWMHDTIKMRYRGLKDIQSTSRERAAGSQRESMPRMQSSPITSSQTVSSTYPLPGHTVLYKGLDQTRLSDLFNPDGTIQGLGGMTTSRQPPHGKVLIMTALCSSMAAAVFASTPSAQTRPVGTSWNSVQKHVSKSGQFKSCRAS